MFKERWIVVLAYVVCTVMAFLAVHAVLLGADDGAETEPRDQRWPPHILPVQPTLEHFYRILGEENFLRYILNSSDHRALLDGRDPVHVLARGLHLCQIQVPGRGILFAIILATAIIPLEVYIIPLYLMVFGVKMMNSYLSLVFPFIIMTFGVFFMRQVIMAIPDELLEAARVDGANEFWFTCAWCWRCPNPA